MGTWSDKMIVCASCRYWAGSRNIDFTASFYTALNGDGKCCNPNSGYRGANMNEGYSCGCYECFKKD